MANMSMQKNKMPEQDAKVRGTNFDEVALGYTAKQAISSEHRSATRDYDFGKVNIL